MAVDTTEKRRNAARDALTQADNLMRAVYALAEIADTVASSGLTFVDSDFAGQAGLAHVDAAMVVNVLSNGPALLQHLRDSYIDDVFNAVRPR